jgi:hypothetical protein
LETTSFEVDEQQYFVVVEDNLYEAGSYSWKINNVSSEDFRWHQVLVRSVLVAEFEEAPCYPENIGSVKCFANKRSLVRSFAESLFQCLSRHLYFQEMPSIGGKKFILGIFLCFSLSTMMAETKQ